MPNNERRSSAAKVPSILVELTDVLESHFTHNSLSNDPHADAEAVIALLAEHFGGRALYLPRGDSLRRWQRDCRIAAERHAGVSIDDLAQRHRLSTRQIRFILDRT
jgi:Mor family transcriptional regulator